jgi:hypothetical protein
MNVRPVSDRQSKTVIVKNYSEVTIFKTEQDIELFIIYKIKKFLIRHNRRSYSFFDLFYKTHNTIG